MFKFKLYALLRACTCFQGSAQLFRDGGVPAVAFQFWLRGLFLNKKFKGYYAISAIGPQCAAAHIANR